MTQLSEHFSLAELTISAAAARKGLSNIPTGQALATLTQTAQGMERVRALLGKPITVLSGYRAPAVNAAVGGAKNSAHMTGHAVDFICPGFGSPIEVARAVAESGIKFDQIIHEYPPTAWVHISFDPRMRGQLLTKKAGKPYVSGLIA